MVVGFGGGGRQISGFVICERYEGVRVVVGAELVVGYGGWCKFRLVLGV